MTRWLRMTCEQDCPKRSAAHAPGWRGAALLAMLSVAGPLAMAQNPTITSISPSTVAAGSAAFTLTVRGTNYNAASGVSVGGTTLAPSTETATLLQVTVPAALVAAPAQLAVVVINSGPAPLQSNTVTLTVAKPGAAPVLTSATPGFPVRGETQVQMTLVGSNFRPGATVVISPPLAALSQSTGTVQAGDLQVASVTVINAGLMTARINVSPTAAVGLRAVDVLNADGTNTATGTPFAAGGSSQPVRVEVASSLGAPLSVVNLSLMHPRSGTVVMRNQELYADAILAGSGTGTVIGQWVWDGNVVEQFSASLAGGTSTTITTHQSLPTSLLGRHTLQLRMVEPNNLASVPITVVVNPGDWRLEQLLWPAYGSAFTVENPPPLLWAPVPGAEKYEVGFSDQPYLSTIGKWFEVGDNRWDVPADVWKELPVGQLYWTVRAIDSNGVARKALPLRAITHVGEDELSLMQPRPGRTPQGHMQLQWMPGAQSEYYFVTISRDFAGTQIVRQYMTKNAKLDLRAVENKLLMGMTYYWQVNAISATGQLLFAGPVQNFIAAPGAGPQSGVRAQKTILLASLKEPVGLALLMPGPPDLTSEIGNETPAPNSTTIQLQPQITVNFSTPVNPADVSLMVDDVDITTLAQVTEQKVTFTPPLALAGGDHTVNLSVGSDATTWKFTVNAPQVAGSTPAAQPGSGPALQPGTDAEAPPAPAAGTMPTPATIAAAQTGQAPGQAGGQTLAGATNQSAVTPPPKAAAAATSAETKKGPRPSLDGQIGVNTQWVSGSNPPDTNTLSAAEHVTYEKNGWHLEANGSGTLNSTLNPPPMRTSHAQFSDYVLQAGKKQGGWGMTFRFGTVSPSLYTDAQFVTAATPRQGAELMLKTPGGTLGGFVNTDDTALGGGSGINFHQQIEGASYQAPLPKWAELRGMWLNAKDTGAPTTVGYDSMGNPIILPNPVAPVSAGDATGALLKLHLGEKWLWTSEYAISYFNQNLADPTSTRQFGRAWRSAIAGTAAKANVSGDYREVSGNFGTPANPSLTQASQPNVRGVDASINDKTRAGTFGITYTLLDNNVHPTTSAELDMNSFDETWSKGLGVKTNLSVEARQSYTTTGTIPAALVGMPPSVTGAQDLRDLYGGINLTHTIGTVSLTAGGTRDWSRNNYMTNADTITSSINAGASLAGKSFFQLNTQGNVNWVAAAGATVGDSRNYTINVQPAFTWKRPGVQVSPLVTLTQSMTVLTGGTATTNTFTGQYGGQLSWTMPGHFKFSTLSAQGSYNENHNSVTNVDLDTTQLLVLWTLTWNQKHAF